MNKTERDNHRTMNEYTWSFRNHDSKVYSLTVWFTCDDGPKDLDNYIIWDLEVRHCREDKPLHPEDTEVDFFTKVEILMAANCLEVTKTAILDSLDLSRMLHSIGGWSDSFED